MENNIFRDVTTQLDLNGPILSWVQEPTIESLTFDVDPALPDGSTTFTLSGDKGADNFTSFASNKIYDLIPRGTFTSTVILKGASGGSDSTLEYGGLGGAVKGTVKFEKDYTYRLVLGKQGPFVDDVVNNGGIGNGGTAYGGDDIGTGIRAAGAAGGGFTGLFKTPGPLTQENALLIAGGGGGAAEGQVGGNGGSSDSDGAGTDATSQGSNTSGGKGGSLTAGGSAGVGDNLHVGDPGSALQGGSTGTNNPKYPGSAGGGGYWGGGSGAGVEDPNSSDRGGGGGGGSSYYSTDTTKVTNGSYEALDNTGGGTASFSVGQGASVIISGVATATFPTAADNSGSIAYRWYEINVGALSDTTKFVGTATTIFTILDLESPTDNGRKFELHVDYVPSQYETGNAINEPLISGITTVNTLPAIEIIAEPSSVQALALQNGSISIDATLTDNSYASDLTYQWILNGEDVTDGTKTVTTSTSTTVAGPVEENFFSPGSHIVPASATNIEVTLAGGQGGDGGSDAGGPGGRGGQGRQGRLFLFGGEEKDLVFEVGRKGNDGTSGNMESGGSAGTGGATDGGAGGGAGRQGWSGGGGGGGSSTGVRDRNYDECPGLSYIGIAGGGGGGGGGSHNVAGENAYGVRGKVGFGFGGGASNACGQFTGGTTGSAGSWVGGGDGGGGGGGGGGCGVGAAGGGIGEDNTKAAGAGAGGRSGYDVTRANFIRMTGTLNEGDGWASLKYNGTVEVPTTTTKNTIITGSNTNKLTLSCDTVGIQTVQCRVSSPEATNTPVLSNEVTFATVSIVNDYPITVEAIGIEDTATISTVDLSNGEYTFYATGNDPDASSITNLYSFFSPDKDINVEMDMYGGKGNSPERSGGEGGEGGYSRIRFTMEKNVEYVLTGLNSSINAPFLYRQATLIAVVGAGGDAGATSGTGGAGGGVSNAGDGGKGRQGGNGGDAIASGTLGIDGIYGSRATTTDILIYPGDHQHTTDGGGVRGGVTIRCAKGVYYAQQGTGACALIGESQFRLPSGTIVTNTASITRGFKDGYNIMQTGGSNAGGDGTGGFGGNGATGGDGGAGKYGGGGGGGGYTDGSVEIIATQLGGSTGAAKCILRVVT